MISLYELSVFILTASSGNMICEQKKLKSFAADSKNIIVSVKCGGNTPNDYDSK